MTQFNVVSVSSFSVAILSFICAVVFFLYARTSVANFVAAVVRILSTALILSKLKILAASVVGRQQGNTSFLCAAAAVVTLDLMENFYFFFKTGFIVSIAGFLILMGYLFILYWTIGSFVLMTIFQKLGFRIMSGLELTYSKAAITYFSVFAGVVLSNVFGLIPSFYIITSGLGMSVAGGLALIAVVWNTISVFRRCRAAVSYFTNLMYLHLLSAISSDQALTLARLAISMIMQFSFTALLGSDGGAPSDGSGDVGAPGGESAEAVRLSKADTGGALVAGVEGAPSKESVRTSPQSDDDDDDYPTTFSEALLECILLFIAALIIGEVDKRWGDNISRLLRGRGWGGK